MQYPIRQMPLVSIGIPTYNGGKRIGKALDSILEQEYEALEIIVSDNCSTDETETIVKAYQKRDPRIVYHRQPYNKGLAANFEQVLTQATGKYFFWTSDDDQLIPGVLERYVDFLENHPEHSLVSGQINYWNKSGHIRSYESNLSFEGNRPLLRALGYYARVKSGAMIYGMMRRELGQKVRFWQTIGSDWHFVAGMAVQGKIKTLDFVGYNKQDGGISQNFHNYARVFGEKKIWGYIPFVKVGIDAFKEISWKGAAYQYLPWLKRISAGLAAMLLVVGHHYLITRPRIFAGKVLRKFKIKTWRQRRLEVREQEVDSKS